MARVDLQDFSPLHVHLLLLVAQRLRSHYPLHVCCPTKFASDDNTWGGLQPVGHLYFFDDVVAQQSLPPRRQGFELLLESLVRFLFLFVLVGQLELVFGGVGERGALEVGKVLHHVLVHSVNHVEDLVATGLEAFEEGRAIHLF